MESIDCEGGPGLNATLVPAGLVDELHLVIAPKLAGGRDPLTILGGETLDPPATSRCCRCTSQAGICSPATASSSTSTRQRGSSSPATTTIVAAGRTASK